METKAETCEERIARLEESLKRRDKAFREMQDYATSVGEERDLLLKRLGTLSALLRTWSVEDGKTSLI